MRNILTALMAGALALSALGAHATTAQAKREALALAEAVLDVGADVRDEFTVGYLRLGEEKVYTTRLQSGYKYWIIVGGCNDAYDMDIGVFDENMNEIGVDTSYSKQALVEVSPRWTGTFYIVVKLAAGTSNGAHFNQITALARR